METLKSGNLTDETVNLNCMLLSNITQNIPGAESVMQVNVCEGKLKGLFVMKLIQWFLTDKAKEDKWQYVATILQNISQIPEGRKLLVRINNVLIYVTLE